MFPLKIESKSFCGFNFEFNSMSAHQSDILPRSPLRTPSPQRKAHRSSLIFQIGNNSLQRIEETPGDITCLLKNINPKHLRQRVSSGSPPFINRPPSPIPSDAKVRPITDMKYLKRKSLPNFNIIDSSESETEQKYGEPFDFTCESLDSSMSPSIKSESSTFDDYSDSGISSCTKFSNEDICDRNERIKKFSLTSLSKIDEQLLEDDEYAQTDDDNWHYSTQANLREIGKRTDHNNNETLTFNSFSKLLDEFDLYSKLVPFTKSRHVDWSSSSLPYILYLCSPLQLSVPRLLSVDHEINLIAVSILALFQTLLSALTKTQSFNFSIVSRGCDLHDYHQSNDDQFTFSEEDKLLNLIKSSLTTSTINKSLDIVRCIESVLEKLGLKYRNVDDLTCVSSKEWINNYFFAPPTNDDSFKPCRGTTTCIGGENDEARHHEFSKPNSVIDSGLLLQMPPPLLMISSAIPQNKDSNICKTSVAGQVTEFSCIVSLVIGASKSKGCNHPDPLDKGLYHNNKEKEENKYAPILLNFLEISPENRVLPGTLHGDLRKFKTDFLDITTNIFSPTISSYDPPFAQSSFVLTRDSHDSSPLAVNDINPRGCSIHFKDGTTQQQINAKLNAKNRSISRIYVFNNS